MNWQFRSSTVKEFVPGQAATDVEYAELVSNAGEVIATFAEAEDGTVTFTVPGTTFLTAGASTVVLDLPEADPEVAGQLWSNAGVVTVSAGA